MRLEKDIVLNIRKIVNIQLIMGKLYQIKVSVVETGSRKIHFKKYTILFLITFVMLLKAYLVLNLAKILRNSTLNN